MAHLVDILVMRNKIKCEVRLILAFICIMLLTCIEVLFTHLIVNLSFALYL